METALLLETYRAAVAVVCSSLVVPFTLSRLVSSQLNIQYICTVDQYRAHKILNIYGRQKFQACFLHLARPDTAPVAGAGAGYIPPLPLQLLTYSVSQG